MNILIIGAGGREHALAWKLAQSPLAGKIFCLPGNPGTASLCTNIAGDVSDFQQIERVVVENSIDIVVVGPENPLVSGLGDYLDKSPSTHHVLFVGPHKSGATLEGSKDFAKSFMFRHHIPTAKYHSFTSQQREQASAFLHSLLPPYVLKVDGLAAGKGVLILDNIDKALLSLDDIFGGKFGSAGDKVVIEEYLDGIELSVFVLTDGSSYMILPQAKDYKRALNDDKGLNTGGMGAVSPVPYADLTFMHKVEERIIKPTIRGLKEEGIKYNGFLFLGLMNCGGDPYVIEYNVRMGDPETEVVMPLIKSDLLSHLVAAASGRLSGEVIEISDSTAVTVVAVSGGYPEEYHSGYPVKGLDSAENVIIFQSGTALKDGNVVTKGGRVLSVTAVAKDLSSAVNMVYKQMKKIDFDKMYYRTDIGNDIAKLM